MSPFLLLSYVPFSSPDHASVHRIYVDAGAGDDVVFNNTNIPSTILGGDGNDSLVGGGANDVIDGGAGNDTINGEGGSDTLTGGDGDDTAEYGDRTHFFQFTIGSSDPTIPLPGAVDVSGWFGQDSLGPVDPTGEHDVLTDLFETLAGSQGPDIFEGYDTRVNGVAQTVTLLGRGGDDTFFMGDTQASAHELGGPGRDKFENVGEAPATINGGGGNDVFALVVSPLSPPPRVSLDGGPGGDTIDATNAGRIDLGLFKSVENVVNVRKEQEIIGTDSANYIDASDEGVSKSFPAGCRVIGNGGNDTIIGGAADDYLDGGAGDDLIQGGGGNDTLFGGDGNDVLAGNSGNDKIHGGLGNDTIIGGTGRDHLFGDDGDDLLLARDGFRDSVYGGSGNNSATVDDSAKVKDLVDEIQTFL